MTITLFENFRAVCYAPYYAVLALDAFAEEGVPVEFATGDAPGLTARGRTDDKVSVWWGGPMRILVDRDQDPASNLVCFCEVVTRDPFFLIGKEPRPDFEFADLAGLRLATVSEVLTPWMCLQDDIRRAGIDPESLDRIDNQPMQANAKALRDGTVDVIQVFEPFPELLVSKGVGHIWYSAAGRGPTTYTSLYTTEQILAEQHDAMLAMTRAIYRIQKWLHASEPAKIAETIASYAANLDEATLTGCIARYKSLDLWGCDPFLPEDGFDRLKAACLSGGLIQRGASYGDCVDNSFARAVIEAGPSPT